MRAPSSTSELFAGEGMKYWWMSFCDPDQKATNSLALIVTGEDHKAMLARSWLLELNPDGEVEFFEIPEQYHSRISAGVGRDQIDHARGSGSVREKMEQLGRVPINHGTRCPLCSR